jgi:cysteinyl-tRNA synthetase
MVFTCGSGWFYSWEAIKMLSLEDSAGILKLGTTWPLPVELVKKLLDKGYAYRGADDSIYFAISKFKDYANYDSACWTILRA